MEVQSPLVNGQVHGDRIVDMNPDITAHGFDFDVFLIKRYIVLLRFFQDRGANLFGRLPGRRRKPRNRLYAILKLEVIHQYGNDFNHYVNKRREREQPQNCFEVSRAPFGFARLPSRVGRTMAKCALMKG